MFKFVKSIIFKIKLLFVKKEVKEIIDENIEIDSSFNIHKTVETLKVNGAINTNVEDDKIIYIANKLSKLKGD